MEAKTSLLREINWPDVGRRQHNPTMTSSEQSEYELYQTKRGMQGGAGPSSLQRFYQEKQLNIHPLLSIPHTGYSGLEDAQSVSTT